MAETIPKCAAPGCNRDLPPAPRSPGRKREYCSEACKVAAWRARHAKGFETAGPVPIGSADPADPVEGLALGRLAPSDEQYVQAVMDARNMRGTFRRLAREVQPRLAWRCRLFAELLDEQIPKVFGSDE